MAKIVIDIDALKSNASSLDARIAELQSLNTRLKTLIEQIQTSWEGEASLIYITKILSLAAKAEKMVDVLSEYKKYVERAISDFSEKDSESANKIRSSF